ncbi:MAG: agmatinase [Candidatus Marinimicrobia bacterium]|jgi:agmatinase|nr:agmatinase [Candidatus Neomarinimicrobiota bacterium]MDD4960718.1 agmatinase [Candidatus Neomarinimicrobiota bacterium]MDD5709745.1 agmatinase [Candidatus Neomarinimicrobiota bacterium]MDX9777134.1 agmatinase [bacterium]
MRNFAAIEEIHTRYDTASVLLQSIPYDGTSTWGKGADKGFAAFLEAAENLELYDIETDSEVYRKGIHILPPIVENRSPESVFRTVYEKTRALMQTGKFLTFFGGEHSISIGIIKAFYEAFPDMTVLHFDAHADLRPKYRGSPYNHACAVYDAAQHANLVQIGIRSMDISEKQYMKPENTFFAREIAWNREWYAEALSKIGNRVYITFDLDVFDPSIMPATGTPEPGGLDWYNVLAFLKAVFREKEVLAYDIVELAPREDDHSPAFLAAKLYYKMLSYKFHLNR